MTNPATVLPSLSPHQAAEVLRSGAALLAEHLASDLAGMAGPALEHLASRQDSEPGLLDARRLLSSRRDDLRRKFLAYLKEEQDEALGRLLMHDKPAVSAIKISADSLSLVDDDAEAPDAVATKFARRIQGLLEQRLRDVHLIVAYLSRREHVRPDDDPLAPEAATKALLRAAQDQGLEAEAWETFLGAMERPMAASFGRGIEVLDGHFRKHRIDVAEVRRDKAARQALGRLTQGPATQKSDALGQGWLDELGRVTKPATLGGEPTVSRFGATAARTLSTKGDEKISIEELIARLGAATRSGPFTVARAKAEPPPPDLVDAINEMQHYGARHFVVGAGAAEGPTTVSGAAGPTTVTRAVAGSLDVAGIDQGAWRDVLLAKSTRTVDKLTIEIVGMVFENVLHDEQVPAEIKAVLSRLQIPVLKVALTDAEFFASSGHPARRLIDRLASTAVGWEPYGDENQRYKAEVERIVQQVLERFDKDVSTFDLLLGEFETFIGALPTRESDPIVRAKAALEEAERREVLVINTTIQVRRAFEHVELEPFLREFLVGPWVQALVSAAMRDEQTPGFSKAFRQVIHDLVWSVQPKVAAEERKRLVALIPGMTRVLRDGMALVKMSQDDQQAFLKQLMASHAIAVRPVDQATYIKAKVATGDLRQKLNDMHITASHPISASGPMRVSANAVKRAAEKHAAQMVIAEPIAGQAPPDFEQDAEYNAQIAGWQRGSWFDLSDGASTIRVKLRWISPHRTLFMFSAGDDKNARVLSPESIKSYLKQGWLKPLGAESLMKRAVDRVVGDLERSPKLAEELAEKVGAAMTVKPVDRITMPEVPRLP